MWCPECRAVVIRRATRVARIGAVGIAVLLMLYIFSNVGTSPRFMMIYLIMIAAAYFFLYRMIQRVAFEVIRSRGVPVEFVNVDPHDE